jgi:hypothetical protein
VSWYFSGGTTVCLAGYWPRGFSDGEKQMFNQCIFVFLPRKWEQGKGGNCAFHLNALDLSVSECPVFQLCVPCRVVPPGNWAQRGQLLLEGHLRMLLWARWLLHCLVVLPNAKDPALLLSSSQSAHGKGNHHPVKGKQFNRCPTGELPWCYN